MKDKSRKLCSNLYHWDWVQTAFRISKMYQKIIKIFLVPQSQVLKGSKRKEKQTENVLNCKIVLASNEEKDTERTQRTETTELQATMSSLGQNTWKWWGVAAAHKEGTDSFQNTTWLTRGRSSTLDKCITWVKHEIKIGRCMLRLDWEKKEGAEVQETKTATLLSWTEGLTCIA